MKFCSKCGTEANDDSVFCSKCGYRFSAGIEFSFLFFFINILLILYNVPFFYALKKQAIQKNTPSIKAADISLIHRLLHGYVSTAEIQMPPVICSVRNAEKTMEKAAKREWICGNARIAEHTIPKAVQYVRPAENTDKLTRPGNAPRREFISGHSTSRPAPEAAQAPQTW